MTALAPLGVAFFAALLILVIVSSEVRRKQKARDGYSSFAWSTGGDGGPNGEGCDGGGGDPGGGCDGGGGD